MPLSAIQRGYACCTSTTKSLVSFPNLQSVMVWAWPCHIKSSLTLLSGTNNLEILADITKFYISTMLASRPFERNYALWAELLLIGDHDMGLKSRKEIGPNEPTHF